MKSFSSPPRDTHRRVLVLVGPTASGKTPLSLLLAKHLDVEILSADSRQIYKLMDIGTAKPTVAERAVVPHYFVDELMPDESFNAGEFGRRGREIIDDIFRRGKTPLVVGGSGLYVEALVDGFFDAPSADPEIRERLTARLHTEGGEALLAELRTVDPAAASRMLPTNTHRIIRALEVYEITGQPLSMLHTQNVPASFEALFFGLRWERKILYDRINKRVDVMLARGLVEEVKKLQEKGYSPQLPALRTVGYREVFDYFNGVTDYDTMVELIKRNSRRYAKRQMTWFNADERIQWVDLEPGSDLEGVAGEMVKSYRKI